MLYDNLIFTPADTSSAIEQIAKPGTTYVVIPAASFAQTGTTFDIETFKAGFETTLAAYNKMLGEYQIDVRPVQISGQVCTLAEVPSSGSNYTIQALLIFSNAIDACYFANIYTDGADLPAFAAQFQPISGGLIFP